MRYRGSGILAALVMVMVMVLGLAASAVYPARAQDLRGLVQQLRSGGYVLVMRHAHAPAAPPSRENAAAANSTLERQLDEQGRDSAKAMGQAIRQLRVPLGPVLSSPTYRALETIRVAALGHSQPLAQLGDGGHSMMKDAVTAQANWLRGKVAERPRPEFNTLIVTHMPNIQAAFGKDAAGLSDGETLVFRPDGKGGAKLVARIKIEDWPRLAKP